MQKKDLKGALETATDAVKEIIEPDYVLMSRVEQAFTLLNQLQISETKKTHLLHGMILLLH